MRWRALAPSLLVATAPACYPGSLDSAEEALVVATVRDTDRDFTQYGTFAMPDEVYDLSEFVNLPIERDGTYDRRILNDFARGMADAGWERVADPDDPEVDVVLLVGAVATNNFIWVGTPGWGYYPGWGYLYPPYWSSVNVPQGTVIGIMVSPSEFDSVTQGVPVLWGAVIQGVLQIDPARLARQIDASIAKAFEQSPYLQVGDPLPFDATIGVPATDAGVDGSVP